MGSHRVGHDRSDLAAAAADSVFGILALMPPKLLDERAKEWPTGPHDHVVIPLLLHRLTFPMSSQQGVSRHRRQGGACGSWAASCLHLFFYIVRAYLESEFTKCSWNGCVNTQHVRGLKVAPSLLPKHKVCRCYNGHFSHSHLWSIRSPSTLSTKMEKEN